MSRGVSRSRPCQPWFFELDRDTYRLGERMLAGSEWQDEDLVFAQANGQPIDKKTDYDEWTRLHDRSDTSVSAALPGRHDRVRGGSP